MPLRNLSRLGYSTAGHATTRTQHAHTITQTGQKRVSGMGFRICHVCTLMQFIEEMQNSAVVFFVKDVSNQDKFVGIFIAFRELGKFLGCPYAKFSHVCHQLKRIPSVQRNPA
jgi:hypothetical protein